MAHIFYDLIVVGRGTAAAAFVNTLDLDKLFPWFRDKTSKRVPRILIVGLADPWQGQRGQRKGTDAPNNKINQPMHMIAQYSDTVPTFKIGGWEAMVDRDTYAQINKDILESFKFADVVDKEIKFVDEISHVLKDNRTVHGYIVTTADDKTYVSQRIVLASGAGPHREPDFLKNALAVQSNPKVIMDMDRFGRDATTLISSYSEHLQKAAYTGAPDRKMKILVFGPNAALDSVESAGFDKLDVTWFVNTDPAILGTNHQAASIAILGAKKEVRFKAETDIKVTLSQGNGLGRIVCELNGEKYIGDILVYGLGQDDAKATAYISASIKAKLLPLFDENQAFGEMHRSALGFYAANNTNAKVVVFGALSQQVANSISLTQSRAGYWAKLGPIIKSEQDRCFGPYLAGTLNAITKCDWLRTLFEPCDKYGRIDLKDPLISDIRAAQAWLEDDIATTTALGLEWDKDAIRCMRSLCVLILNVVTAYTHFEALESEAAKARRKDSKFWQILLNNPSSTLTASTVSSPQIASVVATGAAINGYMPDYVKNGQVNLNQDDHTILRTYIAANYPLVTERDTEKLIQIVFSRRNTANGNWGFSEADAMYLKDTLAILEAQQ